MTVHPTNLTAALAGTFSALAWPWLWPFFNDPAPSSTLWLVGGSLLFIAFPAHALVVGLGRNPVPGGQGIDGALLKRIAAWLAAAGTTAVVMAIWR